MLLPQLLLHLKALLKHGHPLLRVSEVLIRLAELVRDLNEGLVHLSTQINVLPHGLLALLLKGIVLLFVLQIASEGLQNRAEVVVRALVLLDLPVEVIDLSLAPLNLLVQI